MELERLGEAWAGIWGLREGISGLPVPVLGLPVPVRGPGDGPGAAAAVPPRGPRELPLALLELGCSGRFELLSGAPGEAEGPEPRQTVSDTRKTPKNQKFNTKNPPKKSQKFFIKNH